MDILIRHFFSQDYLYSVPESERKGSSRLRSPPIAPPPPPPSAQNNNKSETVGSSSSSSAKAPKSITTRRPSKPTTLAAPTAESSSRNGATTVKPRLTTVKFTLDDSSDVCRLVMSCSHGGRLGNHMGEYAALLNATRKFGVSCDRLRTGTILRVIAESVSREKKVQQNKKEALEQFV